MELNRAFRKLVFCQAMLGIIACCIAERNHGLLLVASTLGLLSRYVVEGPAGRSLPRWLPILGACLATANFALEASFRDDQHLIVAISHFTLWLQILLFYSKKDNREHAQILALSLIQVISASVLAVSMIIGLLLFAYCVVTLFTMLLFRLKTTSDYVHNQNQAAAGPHAHVQRSKPVLCRGYQWQFRATAWATGGFCGFIALLVFLFVPRTAPFEFTFAWQPQWETAEMGFGPLISLDVPPQGFSSQQVVLTMVLNHSHRTIHVEHESWLLRGAVLDRYIPQTKVWTTSNVTRSKDTITISELSDGRPLLTGTERWPTVNAQITLLRPAARYLFTLNPISFIQSSNIPFVSFDPYNQQLKYGGSITGPIVYRIRSLDLRPSRFDMRSVPGAEKAETREMARRWSVKRDQVQQLTLQVLTDAKLIEPLPHANTKLRQQGTRYFGPSWRQDLARAGIRLSDQATHSVLVPDRLWRITDGRHTYLITIDGGHLNVLLHYGNNMRICYALVEFLSDPARFEYTLDVPRIGEDEDPIIQFLLVHRQGHCELFASAMVAMTRSIGIGARLVNGYRASEYNHVGNYYVVRRGNAHAWVEAETGSSDWRTFDPSPTAAVEAEHDRVGGWFSGIRYLYEHLEFTWARGVVAYNQDSRQSVLATVTDAVQATVGSRESWLAITLNWIKGVYDRLRLDGLTRIIVSIIIFFIVIGLLSLARTLLVRQRRVSALQLTSLPPAQRRGLARQLQFYLTMLDMLERRGYRRPPWQSPFGFARELADSQPLRFEPVVALTEIFYEVRFGYRRLDDQRRKRIKDHLHHLERSL